MPKKRPHLLKNDVLERRHNEADLKTQSLASTDSYESRLQTAISTGFKDMQLWLKEYHSYLDVYSPYSTD